MPQAPTRSMHAVVSRGVSYSLFVTALIYYVLDLRLYYRIELLINVDAGLTVNEALCSLLQKTISIGAC